MATSKYHEEATEEREDLFRAMRTEAELSGNEARRRLRVKSSDRRHDKEKWDMQDRNDGVQKISSKKENEIDDLLRYRWLNKKDIESLLQFLFDPKVSLEQKERILFRFHSKFKINTECVPLIFCERMVRFCQDLLQKYCNAIDSFGYSSSKVAQRAPPPKELLLLSPLTRLYCKVVSNKDTNVVSLISEEMSAMYCNAISFIASNINHIQLKINRAKVASELSCKVYKISSIGSAQIVQKLTGIEFPVTDSFIFASYYVILYANSNGGSKQNINEEIIKTQPPMDCTKGADVDKIDVHQHKEFTERSSITIIRICPPKYLLMYMEKDWEKHLEEISFIIESALIKSSESHSACRKFFIGDIVGFAHKEGDTFYNPLKEVPYLRGCIISKYRGNVMLWSMDIGSWTFIQQCHLIDLSDTILRTLRPIVSVGVLKGPVCNIDEPFVNDTFNIITAAVKRYPDVGRQTILSSTGIHLFNYLEYLGESLRIRFLDFLLQLCRSKNVAEHLLEQGLDIPLLGYFECFAHLLRGNLSPNEAKTHAELIMISKILHSIIKINKDKEWYGIAQATRTLRMLVEINSNWSNHYLNILEDLDNHNRSRAGPPSNSKRGPRNKRTDVSDDVFKESSSGPLCIGKKINVQNNETTQIISGQTYEAVDKSLLKEAICALLNNNFEGSVYLGISNDSYVHGIEMKEEDIDSIKKDLECILKKLITPSLSATSFRIQFEKVQHREAHRNLYVIQITLFPRKNVVYFLPEDCKYFVRKGTENMEKVLNDPISPDSKDRNAAPVISSRSKEEKPESAEGFTEGIRDEASKSSFHFFDKLWKLAKK